MHYHWQILTTADSTEEAEDNLAGIMDYIGEGNVWDYYDIGGHWGDGSPNIINAIHSEFWPRIHDAEAANKEELKYLRRALKDNEFGSRRVAQFILRDDPRDVQQLREGLIPFYIQKIAKHMSGEYVCDSHLGIDPDLSTSNYLDSILENKIKNEPVKYWLISVDTHF